MLDVVFRSGEHCELANSLHKSIQDLDLNGTLYFSHPTFGNANADSLTVADALLVSEEHGLVVFDLSARSRNGKKSCEWIKYIKNRQDKIYSNINSMLIKNEYVARARKFTIDPKIITVVNSLPKNISSDDLIITDIESATDAKNLKCIFDKFSSLEKDYVRALNSIIQGISNAEFNTNEALAQCNNFGNFIFNDLNGKTSILNQDQLNAALSYPQGPQRIQGVPGSGKTTIIALKAAHLHVANPNWNIAVTFRNMALASHLRYLIRRFVFTISRDEPDWSKLHVTRCWRLGRKSLFSRVAKACDFEAPSRLDAKSQNSYDLFDGVFKYGLEQLTKKSHDSIYDAILIDDAQELPPSFFQFVYAVTTQQKRIVWATDEFQSLVGYRSASLEKLFGNDGNGNPRVKLTNKIGHPQQDIVFGMSYRNTPRALTVAHAMVCGLSSQRTENSKDQIFQIYSEPKMWKSIGYCNVGKDLSYGKNVKLERPQKGDSIRVARSAGKNFQNSHAVHFKSFGSLREQWKWVSKNIHSNIHNMGLRPENILVVFPSYCTNFLKQVSAELNKKKIQSTVVKGPVSRDQVIEFNNVVIANIFGAKETEFPMVYVVNAHECNSSLNLIKKRNALYTGITRSTAWVRICGVGLEATELEREYRNVKENEYQLKFCYPTAEKIRQMKDPTREIVINVDENVMKTITDFSDVIEKISVGDIEISTLPPELVNKIRNIL